MPVDPTKIHQGPGVVWLGVKVPAAGARLIIDANGNPTETGTVATPAAPGLSQVALVGAAGGAVFVKVTLVNPSGETDASPESTLTVAAGSVGLVQSPPPSANAIGYNVYASDTTDTETLQNPAPIGIGQNYTLPETLTTTGAAAPTQNATAAFYAGGIDGATSFGFLPKLSPIKADQIMGPIDYRPIDADGQVETSMLETDPQKLAFLTPGAIYSSGADTNLPPGFQNYQQITYGGLFLAPHQSVAVISPRANYPGKFVVSQLYSAIVSKTDAWSQSKEKPTISKVTFGGVALTSRTPGDQIGTVWWQV